ncbi:aromatic ring-hydroxylating dioxygenase subunit alpha [Noviherbaspirillum sp. Root189]|uniref:aromatic ring-hydroxylating dioxygenase subunit alpha n=1 Tax=Noviherbaspirillum sp. Root189 TaxID=1736487 RepID=UPI00070B0433|nr:aromatic ring-hydroxylating dioxygenase subunit alpha [Noviherbaspirillum sp. Root189]KRB93568.1 hypothetical protein ASE07_12805 [Noviherbaspirillum sp. Root189]
MYPIEQHKPYPKNQWYVAAIRNEISREMFERRILDEPIVFYRTEAGDPVALAALCPHRLYPLRFGKLLGDTVVCGYHGYKFDCSGRCTAIPAQEAVPARFATKSYPVVDRWELTWIWMGDPELADPTKIPPIERIGLGAEQWRADVGCNTPLKARYSILVDNLMDLSHISYSHEKTLGNNDFIAATPPIMSNDDQSIRVLRKFPNTKVEGPLAFFFPDIAGTTVESYLSSDYYGPCLVDAVGPAVITEEGVDRQFHFIHFITPETPTTTHYFNAISRNFRADDDEFSAMMLAQMARVIAEDVTVLEEIEPHIERYGSTKTELSCQADAGAIRVRRTLASQIAGEK